MAAHPSERGPRTCGAGHRKDGVENLPTAFEGAEGPRKGDAMGEKTPSGKKVASASMTEADRGGGGHVREPMPEDQIRASGAAREFGLPPEGEGRDGPSPTGNVDKLGGVNVDKFDPRAPFPTDMDTTGLPDDRSYTFGPVKRRRRPAKTDGTLGDLAERRRMTPEAKAFWAANRDKAAFGKVIEARKLLERTPKRVLGDATLAEYRRAIKRLDGRLPADMAPSSSRKAAYVYRAAFVHDLLHRRMPEAVDAGTEAIMGMDVAGVTEAAAEIAEVERLLAFYPPDPDQQACRQGKKSFYDQVREESPEGVLAPADPGMSRRNRLGRFPKVDGGDWRTLIWDKALEGRMRLRTLAALASLIVLGVRPKELAGGILVDASREAKVSCTVMKPAKSHFGRYGLDTREHEYGLDGEDAWTAIAVWLHAYAAASGGSVAVMIGERHLRRIVRVLSKRAMPRVDPAVPYDFRHQYAADVKKAATERKAPKREEYVAKRMGHCSGKSQRAYGTAIRSGGGTTLWSNEEVRLSDPSRAVGIERTPAGRLPPSAAKGMKGDSVHTKQVPISQVASPESL